MRGIPIGVYTRCSGGYHSTGEALWSMVGDQEKCPVSGKRKYATEGEALATAAHQIATTNAPRDLSAYLCRWCDEWHLTKNAGKEKQRKKGRRA
ncbi:MAG TPA: hypothetical protein VMB02_09790 [Candidatus Aquilonibacter sp.]|nr:hypothetical protein [Candidatus Aquilonibacter sp.]